MILSLSKTYNRVIAYFFLIIFLVGFQIQVFAGSGGRIRNVYSLQTGYFNKKERVKDFGAVTTQKKDKTGGKVIPPALFTPHGPKSFIGGPSQPEMSSFKSVGTDNLVNLFTGDFNYNIPLLDVGGYPVNIYYSGNITMEQEASWVGLGWNINPGNINRNMRGIPDDFDGTDEMTQQQAIKPNKTWGVKNSSSTEVFGIPVPRNLNASMGVSFNNYLGPSVDLSVGYGVNFALASKGSSEKSANGLEAGLSVNGSLDSRQGLTISPQASLTAQQFSTDQKISTGLSLGTSFNSRVGIKDLQISEQGAFNKYTANTQVEDNQTLMGTTITFARPTYVPTLRTPMIIKSLSADFKWGVGSTGVSGTTSGTFQGYYQESRVANPIQKKPMVGYMYYQNAVDNQDAVMDFTRLGDREVTPKTPMISAPEYSYDVFSIQGEGTGGSVRAYRTDIGYVRDNKTVSKDENGGFGVEVGSPGHYGFNANIVRTPTSMGEWREGNKLKNLVNFQQLGDVHKSVYFRNPGESSVIENDQYNKIGGTDLVRFKLSGSSYSPGIEPILEHCNTDGTVMMNGQIAVVTNVATTPPPQKPLKRTQVVTFLTAEEASRIGLDKTINNYKNTVNDALKNDAGHFILNYDKLARIDGNRKKHHLSQINVTQANGKRYVYGLPVYNIVQQDFTFSVDDKTVNTQQNVDAPIVPVQDRWMSTNSQNELLRGPSGTPDGYVQTTTTPPYAHSFLLTGLLSADYVDVTGDGITEDDLGDAVKFNYTHLVQNHKWRTPLTDGNYANFNPGNRSELKDDKGVISYGERESWYLQSIESKTMIALFFLKDRHDGKGASGTTGGISNSDDQSTKCLDYISLYNKADLCANGLTTNHPAKPIKTVHFVYSYRLCKNTPDNPVADNALGKGKLTLEKIYFTFNGQERNSNNNQPNFGTINQYVFGYSRNAAANVNDENDPDNPKYESNAFDRWGTYKPAAQNPKANNVPLPNKTFPYSLQPNGNISNPVSNDAINTNAGAWALKKILLPSGGQINVDYQSDDYAYVQNKRAAQMMQIAGFGHSQNLSEMSNKLYEVNGGINSFTENDYVFINVPVDVVDDAAVYETYLKNIPQFAFRLAVHMTPTDPDNQLNGKNNEEYVTVYASPDNSDPNHLPYGRAGNKVIWLKLAQVDDYSPLSLTALEYLREQLPGQAYSPSYDVSGESIADQMVSLVEGLFKNLATGLENPLTAMRGSNLAKLTDVNKCFVRLNNPLGIKYGGGSRVKRVNLNDNWDKMTQQYRSEYGQEYTYTTTETFNGKQRTISSGVASYEPAIGGEENPFQEIMPLKNKLPLGPASYGAVEMPMLDALFPAPNVGYSEVTVRSTADVDAKSDHKKTRSGIGKQVTMFYTAKNFPVQYSYTQLDPSSNVQEHDGATTDFFYQSSFDSRALSQGFLVVTNDMHGKLKSQSSYAANDEGSMINYTENFYSNTGNNGTNDKYDFVSQAANPQGNAIQPGNMGIDVELMADTREFTTESHSKALQAQTELILSYTIPVPWITVGESESIYRAVTCTKVVNYHSVVDHVIVIDKGSKVTTENLVYDGETGNVVVNQVNNEFEKPVYSTTYPAYWAYGGMGLAYKNIDASYKNIDFYNGEIITPGFDNSIFESGDELMITATSVFTGCDAAIESPGVSILTNNVITSKGVDIIWAFDKNKTNPGDGVMSSALTNTDPNRKIVFLDADGKPYNKSGVSFRVIRSGKRNMIDAQVLGVTTMATPISASGNSRSIVLGADSKAVNATASEYKEKWQTDGDIIQMYKTVPALGNDCGTKEEQACDNEDNIHSQKDINPYLKGLLGNFSPYRNVVFYDNRIETNPQAPTNLPVNGYLTNFIPYWSFNAGHNLIPLGTRNETGGSPYWVWNSQITHKNAKGQELENKNALGVYTSAQYGYNKTLPVAITNNAAYSETAYDGFEDDKYSNSINGASMAIPSCTKHIDFSSMPGSEITSTNGKNFAAHTGKNVLWVHGGQTATKAFKVANNNTDNFPLALGSYQKHILTQEGGNSGDISSSPFVNQGNLSTVASFNAADQYGAPLYGNGGFSINGLSVPNYLNGSIPFANNVQPQLFQGYNYHIYHSFTINNTNYYLEVKVAGTYSFTLRAADIANNPQSPDKWSFNFAIKDEQEQDIYVVQNQQAENRINYPCSVRLCPGIYHIVVDVTDSYRFDTNDDLSTVANQNSHESELTPIEYNISLTTNLTDALSTRDYKSKNATSDCLPQATPIPGDPQMRNQIFSIPSNVTKSMVLSLWAREDNPNDGTPYPPTNYKNNKVQISFIDANGTAVNNQQLDENGQPAKDENNVQLQPAATATFVPTGLVIDGWQQYNCYFLVPPNAANMALSFVNNSAGNLYFDDIRLHPFNANMKSYVYDPVNQRLVAELDANNYATFYEYDEEGKLIRTKAETKEGIKTITETRSAKQKNITTIQ